VVPPDAKQGTAPGDIIEKKKKNIEGFDVCEFYVDLVSKLKERGL
jgi:triacylglycerol lipase